MRWRDLRLVALDVETTGLNVHDGDRVIEFAAVTFDVDGAGRVRSVERTSQLFDPGIPIPRKVTEITGIGDDKVRGEPPFEEAAERIHALLADAICVAHNLPFDRGFLGAELRRAGLDWPDPPAELDTYDLSLRFFPGAPSHRLADLAERLGVPLVQAHRATDDAEACGRCFVEMARRHEAPEELHEMVEWAGGLGPPPEGSVIRRGPHGAWVFGGGPHEGEPIARHPATLEWMTVALQRGIDGWRPLHPEAVRRWCRTWLRVRAAGRAPVAPKSPGPGDHALDSGAVLPPGSARAAG